MERVSGYLTETPPQKPSDPETVMRLQTGDAVLHKGRFFRVAGFFKGENGDIRCRLIAPKGKAFVRWCVDNPDKVKRLDSGFLINP